MQENGHDQVMIDFSFDYDWLRKSVVQVKYKQSNSGLLLTLYWKLLFPTESLTVMVLIGYTHMFTMAT